MIEKSVYAIIVNPDGKYLLLSPADGRVPWALPGGHQEGTETDSETLTRELGEECKITDFEIVGDFKEENRYVNAKGNERLAVAYLLKVKNDNILLNREHKAFGWFDFDEALTKTDVEAWKIILTKAQSRLTGN